MRLFVEHQIPSDLLSYSGEDDNAPARVRVAAVKQHIVRLRDWFHMGAGAALS